MTKGAHCFAEVNERLCWVYSVLLQVLLSQRCRHCDGSSSRSLGLREIGQNQRKPSVFKASDLCPYYNRRVDTAYNASGFHIQLLLRLWLQPLVSAGFFYLCRKSRWFHLEKRAKMSSGQFCPEDMLFDTQIPFSTTWALMRLVVPDLPRGTPAVMTTVSPGFTAPSFRATSTARENIRSVESTSPDR